MEQYIPKSALVAEIEKRMKQFVNENNTLPKNSDNAKELRSRIIMCKEILSLLDTLEVKEVDLEKEIQQHINGCLNIKFPTTDIKLIAKDVEYTARKFFELGLKAQKEE